MKWSKLLAVSWPFVLIGSVLYGCSTSDRPDAASGDGTGNGPGDDSCSVEGASRDCHELLEVNPQGLKQCLHGTQVCRGGHWSGCGLNGGELEATNIGIGVPNLAVPTKEQLKALAVIPGGGSNEAGACTGNPCDPSCQGWDVDAGPPEAAPPDVNSVVGLSATPSGFQDKLLRDKANSWGKDCERWDTGDNQTGWVHSACQADYYCQRHTTGLPEGDCAQFFEGPNETHAGKVNTFSGGVTCADAYPDLTLATACNLPGLGSIQPICNRGAAAVPAGTTIAVSIGSFTTPTAPTLKATPVAGAEMAACPTAPVDCNVTLPAPLNPGFCFRFVVEQLCGGPITGNKSLLVNSNAAVRECVIQPHVLGPPISAHGPTVEQQQQYGCANNYVDFNNSQIPTCGLNLVPIVITDSATATSCRPDQRVKWGKLAWNGSTPGTSNIVFEVRTRANYGDGAVGAWSAWVQVGKAQVLPTALDPQNCLMTGPAPCPKDLSAPLGDPARYGQDIEIRITLNPGLIVMPALGSYKLAYTCEDYE